MHIPPGQNVAIIGLGRTGLAAAQLGLARGLAVRAFDAGDAGEAGDELSQAGAEVHDGGEAAASAESFALSCDLAVISPGVPPDSALPAVFRGAGIPIISEIEFAFGFSSAPIVGITGTNGKTTTTGLCAAFLNAGGLRTEPAANYGTPYSEIVQSGAEGDVATLEISSFALEAIVDFRPRVAAWLNFDADHLDRYDSLDDYRAAKLRLFENQVAEDGDVAVVNAYDPPPLEGICNPVTFSARSGDPSPDRTLSHDGNTISRQSDGARLDFSSSRLRGSHNAENVMAAAACASAMGVGLEEMGEPLRDFQPPAHRCELIAEVDGVEFINDSKATNLHALASCLRSFQQPIVLIAGGKDKGLDYSPLAGMMEQVKHLVCLGEIGPDLAAQFGNVVPARSVGSMDEAVDAARAVATSGDLVILSPGTSSFDMFSGFPERGDAFRDAVLALSSSTPA